MMGRLDRDQGQFLYCFNLEEVVPEDHLVRAIAAVLDLSWVYGELAPYYSRFGRPSLDPVLMIRMLIVGYVFAIRSERALCRDVRVNLAYRWFCGLSLEDKIPDHSAFSRARNERFRDSDIFRRVFERVVCACMAAGLVGGKGYAVDASLIEADANKSRSVAGTEWDAKNIDPEAASRACVGSSMPRLPAEAQLLSEHAIAPDCTRRPRGRTRRRPRLGENQGLRAIPASAQESRDAVCTFETHPASRPPATAWPKWSAVRVHVCRHRTELATPRQAHRTCAAGTCVRVRFVSIALWHSFRSVVSRASVPVR